MRQTPSIVLIVIAAVLVVGVKVVAPKPGSLRSDFTAVKTAVPSGMKSFPNELLPPVISALGATCPRDVRFTPESGHRLCDRGVR